MMMEGHMGVAILHGNKSESTPQLCNKTDRAQLIDRWNLWRAQEAQCAMLPSRVLHDMFPQSSGCLDRC